MLQLCIPNVGPIQPQSKPCDDGTTHDAARYIIAVRGKTTICRSEKPARSTHVQLPDDASLYFWGDGVWSDILDRLDVLLGIGLSLSRRGEHTVVSVCTVGEGDEAERERRTDYLSASSPSPKIARRAPPPLWKSEIGNLKRLTGEGRDESVVNDPSVSLLGLGIVESGE